jgi:hypothetical protein
MANHLFDSCSGLGPWWRLDEVEKVRTAKIREAKLGFEINLGATWKLRDARVLNIFISLLAVDKLGVTSTGTWTSFATRAWDYYSIISSGTRSCQKFITNGRIQNVCSVDAIMMP